VSKHAIVSSGQSFSERQDWQNFASRRHCVTNSPSKRWKMRHLKQEIRWMKSTRRNRAKEIEWLKAIASRESSVYCRAIAVTVMQPAVLSPPVSLSLFRSIKLFDLNYRHDNFVFIMQIKPFLWRPSSMNYSEELIVMRARDSVKTHSVNELSFSTERKSNSERVSS